MIKLRGIKEKETLSENDRLLYNEINKKKINDNLLYNDYLHFNNKLNFYQSNKYDVLNYIKPYNTYEYNLYDINLNDSNKKHIDNSLFNIFTNYITLTNKRIRI